MARTPELPNVTLDVLTNGPLIVKGLHQIKNTDGQSIETDATIALCRCGASKNKPFCDGAHAKINFNDKKITNRPLDKERAYYGQKITIHDNRRICSHAAFCIHKFAEVFDLNKRPWINPDGADVDVIIKAIDQCPSGALSYTRDESHYRDIKRQPAIEIEKGGPYYITGEIKIKNDNQPPSKEHYALCRCGASKNKPFCDGSHYETHFE